MKRMVLAKDKSESSQQRHIFKLLSRLFDDSESKKICKTVKFRMN